MTRNDFIKRVAEKGKEVYGKRFYYTDIEKYLGLILGTLGDVMAEGEPVILRKFGTFKPVDVKEMKIFLNGGESIVAPHRRVYFKTGTTLMRKINGQEDKTEECKAVEEYDEEWYYGVDYNEQRKKKCEKKSHKQYIAPVIVTLSNRCYGADIKREILL